MATEVSDLTRCSFPMLFSLWCDLFNFIAGIALFHLGGAHILIATGYLLFHLASLLYLMFFKKLGFKFHLKTTRLLIIVPQVFLFFSTIAVRAEIYENELLCKIGVGFGFIWSLSCFLLVIINEYCVWPKNFHSSPDKRDERKVVVEMPRKAVNKVNQQHRVKKMYPDSDIDVQYANEQVQANAPPLNLYEPVK